MVFNVKGMILVSGFMIMTSYLLIAANEDARSMHVTRWKHLIGLSAAVIFSISFIGDRTVTEICATLLIAGIMLIAGAFRIYGMADGYVLGNLTIFMGSICGMTGVGAVILIMILASFSAMTEMFLRKMLTISNMRRNLHIAFVPHIWNGYVAVMVALFICF